MDWTAVRFRKCASEAGIIADMNWSSWPSILILLAVCPGISAQSPIPVDTNVTAGDLLTKPVGANWTSYNGDYTGRRFSSLSG
jgi:hypothetical protein